MTQTMTTVDEPLSTKRLWMARAATFFGYFQLGMCLDMWSASTVALQRHLGLLNADGQVDYASFGYVATGIGLGAVIGSFLSGPLADKIGTRKVLWPTFVLFPLTFCLIGTTSSIMWAVAIGVIIGIVRGALDTVTNCLAVGLEKIYNRPLMGGFQATFPIGGFVGGLVSSHLITWLGVDGSPMPLYLAEGIVLSVLGAYFGYWTLTSKEIPRILDDDRTTAPSRIPFKRAITLITLFGGLLIMSMWIESAFWDWGPSFGHYTFLVSTSAAALAIGCFSLGEFVGRVLCDPLVKRVGESTVMITSSLIGVVGVAVLILIPDGGQLIFTIGLFLVGLGVSCAAPIMLSSAGRVDPDNAGRSIGIVTGVGYFAMLLCPLAMTFLTEHIGIAVVPFVALVLFAAIIIFSPLMNKAADKSKSFEEKFL